MKSSNIELIEFLTNDYIYIPYISKNDLNIRSDSLVFKNDLICNDIYSPISGRIYGLSKISGLDGLKDVLIIENDFKDTTNGVKTHIKDIYKLKKDDIQKITNISTDIALHIKKTSKYDIKDSFILKDYIKEVLETLNVISLVCKVKTKILLDKKDMLSYQILFSYLGTYPNIEVVFSSSYIKDYKVLNIYEVIDIYNKLNNNISRDYIYIVLLYKQKYYIVKTKRYSNLIETISYLDMKFKKVTVNNTVIDDINYLLTEKVSIINIL